MVTVDGDTPHIILSRNPAPEARPESTNRQQIKSDHEQIMTLASKYVIMAKLNV